MGHGIDQRTAPEDERVAALLGRMSLEEKLAQLVGLWLGPEPPESGAASDHGAASDVAPMQGDLLGDPPPFDEYTRHGLGQLTRPMGIAPTDPDRALARVAELQRRLVENTRLGIPALVHEECLTGLQVYGATTYPCPLAWGASWNPDLVERMASAIGEQMRALGVHLGLAPVLDVVTDPRWGRVEECISEDPYLVGVIGTGYVRGLQSAGVGATLKHFAGYSASQAGRNHAPVRLGRRDLAEIYLLPFEMVVREAAPSAVMHSYAAIDGVPVASDPGLLRELLRERWGFAGTVVADYFGVTFLHTTQEVAADPRAAATLAMRAGVDVDLPTGVAYRGPLAEAVLAGECPLELVDEAVYRVLRQKLALGVFDPPSVPARVPDLDPPAHRELARRLAEESVILLENAALLLPLTGRPRVAVVGPNADHPQALMGNYSFTNHVEVPEGTPLGIDVPTVLDAVRAELGPEPVVTHAPGCAVAGDDRSGIGEAVALAAAADVCVAVVGDVAGLFGRGTVGEGSDADDLDLPGVQRELVERVLDTGTPVVLVLLTGRPRAIGWAKQRAGAIVQAFFPGEAGASAIAGVLSGRLNPSGRLSVSLPASTGAQPHTYLHPRLGGASPVTNLDPTPAFPFGHGLSYTAFAYSDLDCTPARPAVDGTVEVACTVTNTGDRDGVEVVQLYTRDLVASVVRPLRQLTGWARVALPAGASARVVFTVPADRLAFVGRDQARIVEPGLVEFIVAPSCAAAGLSRQVELVGEVWTVPEDRPLRTGVRVTPMPSRQLAEVTR